MTFYKHIKRCLKSILISEMEIKATMTYHYIPIKKLQLKVLTVSSTNKHTELLELLYFAGGIAKRKTIWSFHINLDKPTI